MKNTVLFFLISFVYCSLNGQTENYSDSCLIKKEKSKNCESKRLTESVFPESNIEDDYHPIEFQAKIAYPLNKDSSRIWVKGSKKYDKVKIAIKDEKKPYFSW